LISQTLQFAGPELSFHIVSHIQILANGKTFLSPGSQPLKEFIQEKLEVVQKVANALERQD